MAIARGPTVWGRCAILSEVKAEVRRPLVALLSTYFLRSLEVDLLVVVDNDDLDLLVVLVGGPSGSLDLGGRGRLEVAVILSNSDERDDELALPAVAQNLGGQVGGRVLRGGGGSTARRPARGH